MTIDPQRIFRMAFSYNADSILLYHNHPSGRPIPSEDDIRTANRIEALATELRVTVNDQIILGQDAAYSFRFDSVFCFAAGKPTKTLSLEKYVDALNEELRRENAAWQASFPSAQ